MIGPRIKYNRHHKGLESLLLSLDRTGDYFVAGRAEATPAMSVRPVGTIAFPILENQVRALVDASEPAPYGRGPDTILDPAVRDCRQIDAGRIRLSGRPWARAFRSILGAVEEGLGCPSGSLTARLYKLLVYEPGGFFSEHRDSEKAYGMVATLVISLPTAGKGGELVIRHLGRETTVNMQVRESGELAYAAFYADCTHLTKPLESGHRVSLVYNVYTAPGVPQAVSGPPAPSRQADEIAQALSEWARTAQGPGKIVWIMEHAYSEVGLRRGALKGADYEVHRALARAAGEAGCVLQSAILSIEESGMPPFVWLFQGGAAVDLTGRPCPLEQFFHCSYTLRSWVDADLTGSDLPEMPLRDGEALPGGRLDDVPADEQTYFEAAGNEGVSLDRTYRRAAFVFWPRAREVSVIADASMEEAIRYVKRARGVATGTGRELISQLIDCWPSLPERPYRPSPVQRQIDRSFTAMLQLLSRESDDALTERFLRETVVERYVPVLNSALVPFLAEARPSTLDVFFPPFMERNMPRRLLGALSLVAELREATPDRRTPAWQESLRLAMLAAFESLPAALAPPSDECPSDFWGRPRPGAQRVDSDGVKDFLSASHGLGLDSEAERAAALIARYPKQADPYWSTPSGLADAWHAVTGVGRTPAFALLWRNSAERLLERSARPPQPPQSQVVERVELPFEGEGGLCEALRDPCHAQQGQSWQFTLAEPAPARTGAKVELRIDGDRQVCTIASTSVPKGNPGSRTEYEYDIDSMKRLIRAAPLDELSDVSQTLARLEQAVAQG